MWMMTPQMLGLIPRFHTCGMRLARVLAAIVFSAASLLSALWTFRASRMGQGREAHAGKDHRQYRAMRDLAPRIELTTQLDFPHFRRD